jgi:hypothetical protein
MMSDEDTTNQGWVARHGSWVLERLRKLITFV